MDTTLLIRVLNICEGLCSDCPFRHSQGTSYAMPTKALDTVLSILNGYIFTEAILLCPTPINYPRILYVINKLREHTEKLYMFIPINAIEKLSRMHIEKIDEIVFITPPNTDLRIYEGFLKNLISCGFEDIAIYLVIDRDSDLAILRNVVDFARELGLKLRIGSKPYIAIHSDIRSSLIARGIDIGLAYGYLYGLKASRAFIDRYPITILTKPDSNCRKLYIDYLGRVGKCPLLELSYDVLSTSITIDKIREILFSNCSYEFRYRELMPRISISIALPDGKAIPSDVLKILELIEHVKSIRRACSILNIPISTCIEKIRKVEKELGLKLLRTRRGGYSRGITTLTEEAKQIIDMYRDLREAIAEALNRRSITHFYLE